MVTTTVKVGESLTIGLWFSNNYQIQLSTNMLVYIGGVLIGNLNTQTPPIEKVGIYYTMRLSSQDTSLMRGYRDLIVILDDPTLFGNKKTIVGGINFDRLADEFISNSENQGYNLLIEMTVNEDVVSGNIELINAIKGEPGIGIPTGGLSGQVLSKSSSDDYDTKWVDQIDGTPITKTSDLLNDGEDGVRPFITLEDVPTIDLSDYQKIIDPTLETVAQTVPSAINEVRGIAIGANKAFVFDTEAAMEAWLLIPENVALLITGNLLLIRELTVPDYWWDGTQALELEVKIDLTNYYTKLESDNRYSQLTHRHTGETITPDVININKVFTQAEIDALLPNSFFWDDANQTYAFKTADGGTIQINQEPHGYYTNLEGAPIVQMNVVSTTGATGNRTAVKLTDANDDLLANACIGMVTVPSIGNNNVGRITKNGGRVHELNTDVVGWVEGDILYINPLAKGTLTNVMPIAPDRIIKVGILLVKHANQGVIDLQIQVMPKLNELVDGDLADLSDADLFLLKENTTNIWKKYSWLNIKTKLGLIFAKLAGGNTFTGVQSMLGGIKASKIYPQTDSITAIQITRSDSTTPLITFDSINGTVTVNGIGVNNVSIFTVGNNTTDRFGRFYMGELAGAYSSLDAGFAVTARATATVPAIVTRSNSASNGRSDTALQSWQAFNGSHLADILNNGNFGVGYSVGNTELNNNKLAINGSIYNSGSTNKLIGQFTYDAATSTTDTINDRRSSNSSGTKIEEICTVANATKGAGTWVITELKRKIYNLTNNASLNLIDILCTSQTMQVVTVEYTIVAKDATTVRSHKGRIICNVRNQNGVVSSNLTHITTEESDLGTISDTFALTDGVNKSTLSLTANAAGMTPTTMQLYVNLISQGNNNLTIL